MAGTRKEQSVQRSPSKSAQPNEFLRDGEEIIKECNKHWASFLNSAILLIIALLFTVFFHWLVGLAVLVITIYPLTTRTILYMTTRLILTNRRVILRYGFFNRENIQIGMSKVESVHTEQPLLGRFLQYSTVVVRGTGTGAVAVPFMIDGSDFQARLENILLSREETEDKSGSAS